MNKNIIKEKIIVKEQEISILRINNKDYISLTDLARHSDDDEPKYPIQNWMRNKDVISYLGLWSKVLIMKILKMSNLKTLKIKLVKIVSICLLKNRLKKLMLLVLFLNLVIMVVHLLM